MDSSALSDIEYVLATGSLLQPLPSDMYAEVTQLLLLLLLLLLLPLLLLPQAKHNSCFAAPHELLFRLPRFSCIALKPLYVTLWPLARYNSRASIVDAWRPHITCMRLRPLS